MEEKNILNKEIEQNNQFEKQGVQSRETNVEKQELKRSTRYGSVKHNKKSKKKKVVIIILIAVILLLIIGISAAILLKDNNSKENTTSKEIKSEIKKSPYRISSNSLEAFDLYFLQLENKAENKIYSPLSIKYALGMLEEGATGEAKKQISNVIGDYEAKKYTNSKNKSFANAIFINNAFGDAIKDSYSKTLQEKYNAEVHFDAFDTPNVVNSWVNDKTLGLINNLFDDISEEQFLLINALAIDMDWEEKFILYPGTGVHASYTHENFDWGDAANVEAAQFKDISEEISGMGITASFNNYDIVNVLGEENVRSTVEKAFREYLVENGYENFTAYFAEEGITGLSEEELINNYLDTYIEDINKNYKREDKTTDFSLYVDDNVKVFAKDLKEYDGTILQYVGIMPIKDDLTSYVNSVKASDISNLISNLKNLKSDNFTDGVVTKIKGFIPKFKFEYNLDLMTDLKKLGITNVFEQGKANLSNISSDSSLYINTAIHKANMEFTQDGIKAAAVTTFGGLGAAGRFDYKFDVPVEEIDLTFDKPYMFIIRDKNSGEVWFTGTVYNPLLYVDDTTKGF